MELLNGPEFDGFEWDQRKDVFTEWEDRRRDYGEPRFITVGEVDGALITVAWTPRERNRRIITAWPASDQERRIYREHRAIHERRNPQT